MNERAFAFIGSRLTSIVTLVVAKFEEFFDDGFLGEGTISFYREKVLSSDCFYISTLMQDGLWNNKNLFLPFSMSKQFSSMSEDAGIFSVKIGNHLAPVSERGCGTGDDTYFWMGFENGTREKKGQRRVKDARIYHTASINKNKRTSNEDT
jgi:hypothetical protein